MRAYRPRGHAAGLMTRALRLQARGCNGAPGPGRPSPAQLLDQLSQLRPAVTAADQKREQAAFAHRDR